MMKRVIEKAVATSMQSVEQRILDMSKAQMVENQKIMLEKVEELGKAMDDRINLILDQKLTKILKLISDLEDKLEPRTKQI